MYFSLSLLHCCSAQAPVLSLIILWRTINQQMIMRGSKSKKEVVHVGSLISTVEKPNPNSFNFRCMQFQRKNERSKEHSTKTNWSANILFREVSETSRKMEGTKNNSSYAYLLLISWYYAKLPFFTQDTSHGWRLVGHIYQLTNVR